MRIRNLNATPAAPGQIVQAFVDNRELIASAPNVEKEPFAPFGLDIETEKEARNLAIALRNHVRYMGHASNSPSINGLITKLQSIDGIDMTVYAEDNASF